MKITSFTCWTVEAGLAPQFAWRDGLPGSNSDLARGAAPYEAVLQLQTDVGISAAIVLPKAALVQDAVGRRFHHFIGENPLLTERMWQLMSEVDRIEEFGLRLLGILDVLCWAVKSQRAEMPIYQMLGGHDGKVPAYASTVTWPTLEDYERHLKLCRDVGFKAFKLHAWGDVKRDIELAIKLREWVGPEADLMFDGSAGWDYVDALKVGEVLQDQGYIWYEEPMREFYLGAYTKLTDKLSIPILAAETSDGCHWNMATWIENRALDMTRVSADTKGGFTGGMKVAHTSESFGLRCQVHGMGHENAQLCAAIPNNDYYEQLVINEDQIKGLDKLGDLSVIDGVLTVSDKPGLGYDIDLGTVEARALHKTVITERWA